MCKQCFTRSAAILAAVLAHQPIPAPTPEELASTHGDWNPAIVDTLRQMAAEIATVNPDSPDGSFNSRALKGMTVQQLHAAGSLAVGLGRHFRAMAKLTMAEVLERAATGDQEALAMIVSRALEALSHGSAEELASVQELVKTPPPMNPSMN